MEPSFLPWGCSREASRLPGPSWVTWRKLACSPASSTLPASGARGLCPPGQFPLGLLGAKEMWHAYMGLRSSSLRATDLWDKVFTGFLALWKASRAGDCGQKGSSTGFPSPPSTKCSLLEPLQSLEPQKAICLRRGRQVRVRSREERSHVLFLQLLIILLCTQRCFSWQKYWK